MLVAGINSCPLVQAHEMCAQAHISCAQDPKIRVPLDEGRKLGLDVLRESLFRRYKEEIEDVSLDGRRSRFSNYCLTMYPMVVGEQLLTGDVEKLSRVAFKEVVDRWRALSTVERNAFAN